MRLAASAVARSAVDDLEHAEHFLLDELTQALAAALPLPDGVDDLAARRHADVGHQQNLLEVLGGIDVDLAGARLRRVRETDDLVRDRVFELLRGPLQSLL